MGKENFYKKYKATEHRCETLLDEIKTAHRALYTYKLVSVCFGVLALVGWIIF